MNYVVDASAVIPYLVVETYTPNSKALFAQISPPDLLIVPEFCKIECVNVLWKYVRFNNVLLTQAEKLLKIYRSYHWLSLQ